MVDIFLSYASEDKKTAELFVNALTEEGWSVWWDRHIGLGQQFERVIDNAIRSARCVVVLWSSNSVESDWVSSEASEGLERKILVPVKIEDVRIPVAFRNIQTARLDASPLTKSNSEFDHFLASIERILGNDAAVEEPRATYQRSSQSANKPPTPPPNTIAVLPLANITGRDELTYLSDGLADEIRLNLIAVKNLRVLPRSACINTDLEDVHEAGKQLNVEKVVSGRLRLLGKVIKVDVEISTTADEYQSWATTFSFPENQLTDVTQSLVDTVRAQFPSNEPALPARKYAPDPKAYQSYLKGRFHFGAGDTDNRLTAIKHYENAVALDGDYALAYSGIAEAYLLRHIGSNDPTPPIETAMAANSASLTAFRLDPQSSISIGCIGSAYFYDWQWNKAREFLKAALALDPTNIMTRHSYASLLNREGKQKEASAFLEESLQFDALSPIAINGIGRLLRYQGRFEDATATCERLLSVMPNSLAAMEELVEIAFASMDHDLAEQRAKQLATQLGNDHPTVVWHQVRVAAGRGDQDEVKKYVSKLTMLSRTSYVNTSAKAFCRLFMGEPDRCFDYLDRAATEKDPWLIDLKLIPLPGFIRSHERFIAVCNAIENSPARLPTNLEVAP